MDKTDLLRVLIETGLSDKEAKVYLVLLELKEAIPSTISRMANVKRPTTYVILEQLQQRGLVSHVRQEGKYVYYRALPPSLLLEREYNKYNKLEKALPDLRALHQKFHSQPEMSLYEGRESLVSLFEDSLTSETEILCLANANTLGSILNDYESVYLKKRIARDIPMKCVYTYNKKALMLKKRQKKDGREIYLVPEDKFPMDNQIIVYDDKVAICSLEDEIGVIIQNSSIADSQRTVFNMCFEYAKQLEKEVLTEQDKKYLAK